MSVAAVVVNEDSQILVIRRRDNGEWQIPGGVLELGEPIHDGLRREVREETGLEVEPGDLTGIYKNMKLSVVALVFRATVIGGTITISDESVAVEWWPLDAVTQDMTEAFAVRVHDAIAPSAATWIRHHDGKNIL